VELCGEEAPDDRAELMEVYNRLRAEKRIEFVTFHQSFSYEDFVEGLRPPMDDEGEDEEARVHNEAPGLRLKVHKGIFRDIAERALIDAGDSSTSTLDNTRSIFKVALGERGTEEAEILAALNQNEITLGWGGRTDWSDSRFDQFSEILDQWRADGHPDATGKDSNVEQIFGFRSWLQEGDYVVVSDGRDRFRALGQVIGPTSSIRISTAIRIGAGCNGCGGTIRAASRPFLSPRVSPAFLLPPGARCYRLGRPLSRLTREGHQAPRPAPLCSRDRRDQPCQRLARVRRAHHPDRVRQAPGQTNALEVRLPYSQKPFGVPGNLHILGTMNTADRSVALLDTALRRRFEFTELQPDATKLMGKVPGLELDLVLHTINQRLEYLIDRDHRVGHAFFMHCATQGDVDQVMRRKVLPLLQEYFFEDWSMIAAVVGSGFIRRDDLPVPPALKAARYAARRSVGASKRFSTRMPMTSSSAGALRQPHRIQAKKADGGRISVAGNGAAFPLAPRAFRASRPMPCSRRPPTILPAARMAAGSSSR
jgi:5-methylcytosine-specific restriction protein B